MAKGEDGPARRVCTQPIEHQSNGAGFLSQQPNDGQHGISLALDGLDLDIKSVRVSTHEPPVASLFLVASLVPRRPYVQKVHRGAIVMHVLHDSIVVARPDKILKPPLLARNGVNDCGSWKRRHPYRPDRCRRDAGIEQAGDFEHEVNGGRPVSNGGSNEVRWQD